MVGTGGDTCLRSAGSGSYLSRAPLRQRSLPLSAIRSTICAVAVKGDAGGVPDARVDQDRAERAHELPKVWNRLLGPREGLQVSEARHETGIRWSRSWPRTPITGASPRRCKPSTPDRFAGANLNRGAEPRSARASADLAFRLPQARISSRCCWGVGPCARPDASSDRQRAGRRPALAPPKTQASGGQASFATTVSAKRSAAARRSDRVLAPNQGAQMRSVTPASSKRR